MAFRTAMKKGKAGQTYLLGSANMTHQQFYKNLEKVSGVKSPFLRVPSWILVILLRVLFFITWRLFRIWLKEKDPVWAEMGSVFWSIDSSYAKRDLKFQPRDPTLTLQDTVHWLINTQRKKNN